MSAIFFSLSLSRLQGMSFTYARREEQSMLDLQSSIKLERRWQLDKTRGKKAKQPGDWNGCMYSSVIVNWFVTYIHTYIYILHVVCGYLCQLHSILMLSLPLSITS